MNYAGAIFDQDGLLFDTEIIYQRAWIEAARARGVAMPAAFPRQFCGLGPARIRALVGETYPQLDAAEYARAAVDLAWRRQLAGVPVKKPGLVEMLTFCRAHGLRTAVASSSPRRVVEHNLAAAGVRDFFDAIATGDEVARSKPDPDIFLLAAARIGVDPCRCVVFEDAFSGICGARAAGCRPVLIPDLLAPTAEIRRLCTVFPDLAAARAVFQE
ncbi:MAG: HAD family hydrolase [Kiritimatiellia bacterium]